MRIRYKVQGCAAQGSAWRVEGEREGTIPTLFDVVMMETFRDLTGGRAQFGDPRTCRGPYTITRVEMEVVQ